jgi:hypothetical protein
VTHAFYRPSGVGNVAFHAYPMSWLRFELLGQAGNENGYGAVGGRPAVIADFGWVKLKGGAEYRRTTPVQNIVETRTNPDGTMSQVKVELKELKEERGFGGGIQFLLYPYVEFGLNAGRTLVDRWDRAGSLIGEDSFTTTSFGGFANARVVEDLLVGAGVNWTTKTDIHLDSAMKVGHFAHLQTFGAIQYLVAKQLFIKAVAAYARADYDPSFEADPSMDLAFSNYMYSGRVRLLYLF